jgi:hypothetical protein
MSLRAKRRNLNPQSWAPRRDSFHTLHTGRL